MTPQPMVIDIGYDSLFETTRDLSKNRRMGSRFSTQDFPHFEIHDMIKKMNSQGLKKSAGLKILLLTLMIVMVMAVCWSWLCAGCHHVLTWTVRGRT